MSGEGQGLRVLGVVASAITLAAVAANVVWFARRGIGPGTLLAIAGPLWLLITAGIVACGALAWGLARLLGRDGGTSR